MKKWKVGRGKKIKTKYACIKFNTFVPMATIQHVIHLSSRIRADGVHCLGPGEHGCLEQRPPPLPPSERHPGHSPCCYFSLIHIGLVFSLLITRQMTKKKREGDNAVQYWGMAFMILMNTIRRGGGQRLGLGRNSGARISGQHLKDSPFQLLDLVGGEGSVEPNGLWLAVKTSLTVTIGEKGHLTSVIFSNMLRSCCWLPLLKYFLWEYYCWMLRLRSVVLCFKTFLQAHCSCIFH